jgi:arsenate reductase-like glutaredoxin family protein
VVSQVDARKATITRARALDVLAGVDEVYATKGRKVVHVDLGRDEPDRATLESLLVGPSGNLRAPVLRRGRTLLVGFDEATYAKVLG